MRRRLRRSRREAGGRERQSGGDRALMSAASTGRCRAAGRQPVGRERRARVVGGSLVRDRLDDDGLVLVGRGHEGNLDLFGRARRLVYGRLVEGRDAVHEADFRPEDRVLGRGVPLDAEVVVLLDEQLVVQELLWGRARRRDEDADADAHRLSRSCVSRASELLVSAILCQIEGSGRRRRTRSSRRCRTRRCP